MSAVEVELPQWTRGDRLAKARRLAGLTQEEMADRLGTTKQSVSNWENDLNQPRNLTGIVDQWSEITHVPAAWLLGFMSDIRWNPDSALQDVREGYGDVHPVDADPFDAPSLDAPPRHLRPVD